MIRKDKAALLAELKSFCWLEDPAKPEQLRAPPHLMRHTAGRTFHAYEADIVHQILFALEEGRANA